jgi:hypothetical protein
MRGLHARSWFGWGNMFAIDMDSLLDTVNHFFLNFFSGFKELGWDLIRIPLPLTMQRRLWH